jgi:hypothetical protein
LVSCEAWCCKFVCNMLYSSIFHDLPATWGLWPTRCAVSYTHTYLYTIYATLNYTTFNQPATWGLWPARCAATQLYTHYSTHTRIHAHTQTLTSHLESIASTLRCHSAIHTLQYSHTHSCTHTNTHQPLGVYRQHVAHVLLGGEHQLVVDHPLRVLFGVRVRLGLGLIWL